jgi:hypothetical protein
MMILDEAHGWLNARTWDADETGQGRTRAEATKRRLDIVQFFALHRKFGWTVYLITQDEKRLDVQVRSNFQEHIHLKNLKGWKVPILGIPLFPVNMFVAVTTWHDNEASRLGVETYFLNRRVANLYDTMAISGDHAYDRPDAIYLGGIRPQLLPPGAPSELIQ